MDCDKILDIVQTFLITYDCDKLNNGDPTNIIINITTQSFDEGKRIAVDNQKVAIPVNGDTENLDEILPDKFGYDTNGANSGNTLSGGIYNNLLDCLDQNPDLLAILESLLLGVLDETINNGNSIPNDPNETEQGGINSNGPFFGMEIHYFDGNGSLEAASRYNGNISWTEWKAFGQESHAYGFSYDKNNRLTKAIYGEKKETENCRVVKTDKYSVPSISYDVLGNIQALERRGLLNPDDLTDYEYDMIDALTFVYNGSPNLLNSVIDNSEIERGYKGGTGLYTYDPTGNMDYLSNKTLSIDYAFNDLPVEMITPNGKIINFYTSNGIKLKSVFEPEPNTTNSGPVITNYFQSQEYQNTKLHSIYFEEGRASFVDNPSPQQDEQYIEYFLKDHLGNTRVRVADKNSDFKLRYDVNNPEKDELMSIHHYYPFGMEWDVPSHDANGNALGSTGLKSKYTYNGKEFIDDLYIDLHDYGARYYDSGIARWTSVDPLAEEYGPISSYSYVLNNPLIHIDPDGMAVDTLTPSGIETDNVTAKQDQSQQTQFADPSLPPSSSTSEDVIWSFFSGLLGWIPEQKEGPGGSQTTGEVYTGKNGPGVGTNYAEDKILGTANLDGFLELANGFKKMKSSSDVIGRAKGGKATELIGKAADYAKKAAKAKKHIDNVEKQINSISGLPTKSDTIYHTRYERGMKIEVSGPRKKKQ